MADDQGNKPTIEADATDGKIIKYSETCIQENREARRLRLEQNRINWDVYHLNQDFSHKRAGQSREFLPKQAMAVEQITEFFQQGIMDLDDWWRCDYSPGADPQKMPLTNIEIKKLTDHYSDKLDGGDGLLPKVGDSIKSGLLSSVIIIKVHGGIKNKPFYTFENKVKGTNSAGNPVLEPVIKRGFKDAWELEIDLLQPFEYGQDPAGKGLYEFQEIFLDWHEAIALSTGPNKIYDRSVLDSLGNEMAEEYRLKLERSRETNQPIPYQDRKKIKIVEFWGNVIDTDTGELLHENVVWTIANDRWVIQKPTPNPFWHGESPFVTAPILRVPNSVWHKALMDSPTKLNLAANELYNLMLDDGMMSAYGIKQYRPDWLADDSSVSEGIYPGQSLAITSDCPPGAKVVERVDTSSGSGDSLSVFNLLNAEFNQAALTNDLRMGVMPNRAVKATEVVEASNSINSIFTGLAKVLEQAFMEKMLTKVWKVVLQNADNLDSAEMQALFGKDRAREIAAISAQQRFVDCIEGTDFKVFGVSKTLAKSKEFKKLMSLMQTVFANPLLTQEFTSKYSPQKLLSDIMDSLDINVEKLTMTPEEQQATMMRMQMAQQQQMQLKAGGNIPANGPGGTQGDQSQIHQATTGPTNISPEGLLPSTNG